MFFHHMNPMYVSDVFFHRSYTVKVYAIFPTIRILWMFLMCFHCSYTVKVYAIFHHRDPMDASDVFFC